jgi:hypothetical protein
VRLRPAAGAPDALYRTPEPGPIGAPAWTGGAGPVVTTATYLGGPGADEAAAVAISREGRIVVGGRFGTLAPGPRERPLLGAGPGAILVLPADGARVLAVTRLGADVRDLEMDPATGRVAVAGDFGVALVDPFSEGEALVFHERAGSSVARVSIGESGTVAALDGEGHVRVLGPDGTPLARFWPGPGVATDLAVDDGHGQIVVAGFNEQPVPGRCSAPLPVAFLRSFDRRGAPRWRAWDYPPAAVVELGSRRCAHSRLQRVVLGADRRLYAAGDSYGGDTPFALDPQDPARLARNVGHDAYTSPLGGVSHRAPMGYLARLAPDTGALEVGQFLLGRGAGGQATGLVIRSLAADEQGNVLVGGSMSCCLPGRAGLRFAGVSLGLSRSEGFVAMVEASFGGRAFWTSWTGTASSGARAVALADGTAAVVSSPPAARAGRLITANALAPAPLGARDAWLAVLRVRP